MKNLSLPVLLLSILFTFSACEENDSPKLSSEDYLIFGKFAGFCLGDNCVRIFKLDKNQLGEDTLDKYPDRQNFYIGDYTKLDKAKYDKAVGLLDKFPTDLLNETDTVFGCPDCADQGGYYLELNLNTTHKFWIIDTSKGSVPEYLHEYMDELSGIIEEL